MTDNDCSPDTEPLSEADVLASIGGWRIGCEIEQENRYIVSKCDLAGYLAIRKHYAPVTPEGDPAWQLTDIGLRRLASIGTCEQFCDAINMRDWYRANASKPAPPQSPGLREALEVRSALDRCRNVLWNMALENEGAIFNRWPINHEPLRNDARGLIPVIDSALEALAALSASVAGEADHCKKCGCELNGEAALVGDEVLCHPCADAAPSPAPDPGTVEACAKVVDRWISDITKAGDQFDKGGDIYAHANVLQGVASAIRALASPAPGNADRERPDRALEK